jgi:DNA-binding NarL/FixJ family response regulator
MLREALSLLENSVARYELAAAQAAVAEVSTDPAERERLLRAAWAGALECGSPALYRRAAARLIADGVAVPPDPETVLTPTQTERRIVAAVSRGFSYREVAEALFLTPARVERTLVELRSGLGVATDAELAAVLAADRS